MSMETADQRNARLGIGQAQVRSQSVIRRQAYQQPGTLANEVIELRKILSIMTGLLAAMRDYQEGVITADIFPARWPKDADEIVKRARKALK